MPALLPENQEAIEVYLLCKTQLLTTVVGDILGIRLEAIKSAIDLIKPSDPLSVVKKINFFVEELYKKWPQGLEGQKEK